MIDPKDVTISLGGVELGPPTDWVMVPPKETPRLDNRKMRRTWRKRGITIGKVAFRSVRVERADGRCIKRELRR